MYSNVSIICRLTVQKEGPNTGRQFYTCPKPRGQGCNFFQWADEPGGATGGAGGATGGAGGGWGRGMLSGFHDNCVQIAIRMFEGNPFQLSHLFFQISRLRVEGVEVEKVAVVAVASLLMAPRRNVTVEYAGRKVGD